MAKIWPSWQQHGPLMAHQISSSWILINVPRDVPFKISYCWVYLVAPFPRNGQKWPFMAKTMSSHGPSNCSSWIIINVPREATCQISQYRVYPMVPFSKNWPKYGPFLAKTWSSHGPSNWFFLIYNHLFFYGQNMVLTWSFKLVLPEF